MFNNISYDIYMPHSVVEPNDDGEMDKLNLQHISRLEVPITLTPNISTIDDIKTHMLYRQRLSKKHIVRIWTHLENQMKKYGIDPTNPNYVQWQQYMDYMETVENTPPSMLKFIWNYWRHILTSYGIPNGRGTSWNYKPPSIPPSKPRYIPNPEQIYQLVHYDYNIDPKRKALCQYSLLHSVIFGWRNPSETCMLRLGDIDFDEGKIIVTEKKKHNRKRVVLTEYPQIMNNHQVKSIKNWVDIWRPRLVSQYSQDYLYLRATDGRPLNERQYTNFITRIVRPVFPWFTMYCTRHFCATGLLIKEYLETGYWNKHKVKSRLGHENDNTTDTYVKYAEEYLNRYRFDWFKRILKNHRINIKKESLVEDNPLKSTNPQKTLVSHGNSPSCSVVSEQRYTCQQGKHQLINWFKKVLSFFQPLTKTSFFSYNKFKGVTC